MNKLVFKNYVWPQNPDHYEQRYVREPVYTKNEDGETVFSGMGPRKLTITGSGCFIGESAYAELLKLAAVFDEETWGGLVHPVWGTYRVFFTELELTTEPRADYVAYRFTFREADIDGNIPQ